MSSMFANEAGMQPERSFMARNSPVRFVRLPNSGGTLPVSWVLCEMQFF